MKSLRLECQPYLPGRVKDPVRIGKDAATRDGISVIEQYELGESNDPRSTVVILHGAPFSHAMIRLQGNAIPCAFIDKQAGHKTKEIQINGQLACMPGVLPVLLGLGYRIFSVDPLFIPYLGETIKQTDTTKTTALAQTIYQAGNRDNVKQLMEG